MSRRFRIGFLTIFFAVVSACESSSHDALLNDQIVGGEISPASDDAVVFVGGGCTGTLIAPNLVLTAAHCVVTASNVFDCGNHQGQPSRLLRAGEYKHPYLVLFGPSANEGSKALGSSRVGRILLPEFEIESDGSIDLCERDIALLILSENARYANGAPMPTTEVSFAEPRDEQSLLTVGYGVATDSQGSVIESHPRLRVQRIYHSQIGRYAMASSWPTNESNAGDDLGRTELVVFGPTALWGDSGGPSFIQDGEVRKVFGVSSRLIEGDASYATPWLELLRQKKPRCIEVTVQEQTMRVCGLALTSLRPHQAFIEEGLREASAYRDTGTSPGFYCSEQELARETRMGVCPSALHDCLITAAAEIDRTRCHAEHEPSDACRSCLTNVQNGCAILEGGDDSCQGAFNCLTSCQMSACDDVACMESVSLNGGVCSLEYQTLVQCRTQALEGRCKTAAQESGCF